MEEEDNGMGEDEREEEEDNVTEREKQWNG